MGVNTEWICSYCGCGNPGFGSCVTEGCVGEYLGPYAGLTDNPKEKNMNAGLHPIKDFKQFRTMYDVIFELHRLGAVLTGSRAFGMEHQDSDWDFVISERTIHGDAAVELLSWFKTESDSVGYKDGNTLKVLVALKYPIHVQVSKDIEKKLAAQELLLSMPQVMQQVLLGTKNKAFRRRVWDWALKQVGGKN